MNAAAWGNLKRKGLGNKVSNLYQEYPVTNHGGDKLTQQTFKDLLQQAAKLRGKTANEFAKNLKQDSVYKDPPGKKDAKWRGAYLQIKSDVKDKFLLDVCKKKSFEKAPGQRDILSTKGERERVAQMLLELYPVNSMMENGQMMDASEFLQLVSNIGEMQGASSGQVLVYLKDDKTFVEPPENDKEEKEEVRRKYLNILANIPLNILKRACVVHSSKGAWDSFQSRLSDINPFR